MPDRFSSVLAELERMGTAQNRKVYARHGAGENCYGVSFANLNKLKKKIGRDHALARALWDTGNADARVLATMVADPATVTAAELDRWVSQIRYYVLADSFSSFVSQSPLAREKIEQWMGSAEEFTGQTGWNLLAVAAMKDSSLPASYFVGQMATIEERIHTAPNRIRHAMNNALIAIGIRDERLRRLALAAAARIGKVVVNHGETGCKTPDAASYIERTWNRKKQTPGKVR